jgi:hypothetical protein
MFPIVGFFGLSNLGIIGSQIEIEIFVSLTSILQILRDVIYKNLIFMSRNWPNDPRDGCKPPLNLIELIQTYLYFEE